MKSLVLRLLLCATLLFNGMASAVASAHVAMMALDAGAMAEAAQPEGHDMGVDCPHAAMQAAATQASPSHAAPASPAGVDTDCLQQCIDVCLQHCQAMITAMPAVATAPHAAAVPMPAPAGQAAPMRHPLLRPPIAG
ncbi:CopL family metal-binding regulatory protein [Luteimonas aestuarii]|uniref:CopL family metal-binding regulatory protein n=1 Tax=Luteimonas aestuarii TaxID=453837 RepID=A0A4R5TVH2_9GAMM|nr:CopL family metal-binding regulatory protein [Luteimonas aestuarii]TDK25060.1 CopL family metal-binding regulatory protein [Luteimonas aestuarii]